MKTMIDEMVSRFLCWELPRDFAPDCGVSFTLRPVAQALGAWPTGTNLLTAPQARKMFEHCMSQQAEPVRLTDDEIKTVWLGRTQGGGTLCDIARAIETASFRKNGLLPPASGD